MKKFMARLLSTFLFRNSLDAGWNPNHNPRLMGVVMGLVLGLPAIAPTAKGVPRKGIRKAMPRVGKASTGPKVKKTSKIPPSKYLLQVPWTPEYKEAWRMLAIRRTGRDDQMSELARRVLEQFVNCECNEQELKQAGLFSPENPFPQPADLRNALDRWNERYPQQKLVLLKK